MKILFVSALFLTVLVSSTFGAVLLVDSQANIFGSGFATNPVGSAPGSEGTTLPPSFSFTAASGQTLLFSSVLGTVICGGVCGAGNGADGGSYPSVSSGTDISSPGNGISGIVFVGRQMFLVGVFLDDATPSGPGPLRAGYDSASADALSFAPTLGQTFFIGDGSGGLGAQQSFLIPSTATRLFLGFADANGFVGTQGAYLDNSGSLNATFQIVTPEPGTIILMGLGLVGLGLVRRKIA